MYKDMYGNKADPELPRYIQEDFNAWNRIITEKGFDKKRWGAEAYIGGRDSLVQAIQSLDECDGLVIQTHHVHIPEVGWRHVLQVGKADGIRMHEFIEMVKKRTYVSTPRFE